MSRCEAPSELGERRLVPEEGVEPTHSCEYGILSPARLPVPPLRPELWIISCQAPPLARLPNLRQICGLRRDDPQLRKVMPIPPRITGEQGVAGHGRVSANVEIRERRSALPAAPAVDAERLAGQKRRRPG